MLPGELDFPPDSVVCWTIYDSPTDYPGEFVLRPHYFTGAHPSEVIAHGARWTAKHPDTLRRMLPIGVICLGRSESDDPAILEVWI